MKTSLALLLAVAAALVAAGTAAAKPPPLGAYECTIGSANILFGTVAILGGGRYTKDGTKGTYSSGTAAVHFSDGITGFTLRFKGGSLNAVRGRWYRATGAGVAYEIALKNPRDGFESIYCEKRG